MVDRERTDRIQEKLQCVRRELQDGRRDCGDNPSLVSAWGLAYSILVVLLESIAGIAQLEKHYDGL